MNDDVTRYLDGELPGSDLDSDARLEAEAWDRLLSAFEAAAPRDLAPPWLEDRVMAEIEALPEPTLARRLWSWLVRPQTVRVPPLWAGVAAAAVMVLLALPSTTPTPRGTTSAPGASRVATSLDGEDVVVYVQFVLNAPGAASVAVAGDFDGWTGSHTLADTDGDGVWVGRVPVRPGVHQYMFVVDGSDWVTDPDADRYADDGFGGRNAVLAVTVPTA